MQQLKGITMPPIRAGAESRPSVRQPGGDSAAGPMRRAADVSAQLRAISLEYKHEELASATMHWHASRRIGKGCYGAVYRGELKDGSVVAIKAIDLEAILGKGDAPEDAGFDEEVLMLSKFRHPNLVTLLGWGQNGLSRYLVYEFLAGGDVFSRLHRSRKQGGEHIFTFSDRLSVSLDAATGLSHMHNSTPKAFHRDIKTANILLDRHGSAKMADFGLSCTSAQSGANHVQVKTVSGTPGYKCPIYEKTGCFTEGSEVYSFGMVLLELLVGLDASAMDNERAGGISYPIEEVVAPNQSGAIERCMRNLDASASWPLVAAKEFGALSLRAVKKYDESTRPLFVEIVRSLRSMQERFPAIAAAAAAAAAASTAASNTPPQQPPQQPFQAASAASPARPPVAPRAHSPPSASANAPRTPSARPQSPCAAASPNKSTTSPARARRSVAAFSPSPNSPEPSNLGEGSVLRPDQKGLLRRLQTGAANMEREASPRASQAAAMRGFSPVRRAGFSNAPSPSRRSPGPAGCSPSPKVTFMPQSPETHVSEPQEPEWTFEVVKATGLPVESLPEHCRWLPLSPESPTSGPTRGVQVGRTHQPELFEAWLPNANQRSCISRTAFEVTWAPSGGEVTLQVIGSNVLSVDGRVIARCGTAKLRSGSEVIFSFECKVLLRLRLLRSPGYEGNQESAAAGAQEAKVAGLTRPSSGESCSPKKHAPRLGTRSITLPAFPPEKKACEAADGSVEDTVKDVGGHSTPSSARQQTSRRSAAAAGAQEGGRWRLAFVRAEGLSTEEAASMPAEAQFLDLPEGTTLLGRHHQHSTFGAWLPDPLLRFSVAWTQAELRTTSEGLRITNTNSSRLYANGEPVAKGESRTLSHGQPLTFARAVGQGFAEFLVLEVQWVSNQAAPHSVNTPTNLSALSTAPSTEASASATSHARVVLELGGTAVLDVPADRRRIGPLSLRETPVLVGRRHQPDLFLRAVAPEMLGLQSNDHFCVACDEGSFWLMVLTNNPLWRERAGEGPSRLERDDLVQLQHGDHIVLGSCSNDAADGNDHEVARSKLFWTFTVLEH